MKNHELKKSEHTAVFQTVLELFSDGVLFLKQIFPVIFAIK